jgi:hypothetical protein
MDEPRRACEPRRDPSVEVRSGRTTDRKFKTFGVPDAAKWILSTPLHAPPAHYSFTLADPYASLTGGQRETIDQRALEPIGSRWRAERSIGFAATAAFRVAYLSGQPVDASLQSSREWSR